jgi:hypothetical protein
MLAITFILIKKEKKKTKSKSYAALLITAIAAPFLILEINIPLEIKDPEEPVTRTEEQSGTKKPEIDGDYIPTVKPKARYSVGFQTVTRSRTFSKTGKSRNLYMMCST